MMMMRRLLLAVEVVVLKNLELSLQAMSCMRMIDAIISQNLYFKEEQARGRGGAFVRNSIT